MGKSISSTGTGSGRRQRMDGSPQAHGTQPKRPPQPKSTSLSKAAKTELLIDFDDSSPANPNSKQKAKPAPDAMSLFDSSIAEKYEYLPAPLGERERSPSDPFKVDLSLASINSGVSTHSSGYGSHSHVKTTEGRMSPSKSRTTYSAQQGRVDYTAAQKPYASKQLPSVIDRNSADQSSRALLRSNDNTSVSRQPTGGLSHASSTTYGNVASGPYLTSPVSSANELSGEPSSIPPIPPRTYMNLPGDSPEYAQKPLPPEPDVMVSPNASSPYYSMPPVDVAESRRSPRRSGRSVQSVPMTEAQQKDGKVSVNSAQTLQPIDSNPVTEAFDWLNEAVGEFSLQKSSAAAVNNSVNLNATTEKRALNTWENKDMYGGKQVGHSVFYDMADSDDGLNPSVTHEHHCNAGFTDTLERETVLRPKAAAHVEAAPEQEDVRQRRPSRPPTLPPRDPVPTSWSPMKSNWQSDEPIIRPIVRDGQQLSETHYWLLPDKDKTITPIRTQTYDPNHSEIYQNLGGFQQTNPVFDHSSPSASGVQPQFFPGSWNPPPANTVPQQSTTQWGGDTYSSWGQVTGMTAVGSSPSRKQQAADNTPSMTSLHDKIYLVQKTVHGVTEEECQAALSAHRWEVIAASRYLKVEQLFRLGVASREKCQHLLETYKWDLQTASSVLLDEYSKGSSV